MTNENTLREVFMEILEMPPESEPGDARLFETPGWDSMGHMSLMIALEDTFKIEFEADHIIQINSYEMAVTTLRELGCAL